MSYATQLDLQGFLSFRSIFSDLFHDRLLLLLSSLIAVLVASLRALEPSVLGFVYENSALEAAWTILPGVILLRLVGPSLKMLFLRDERANKDLDLIAIGNQWFWSYYYPQIGRLRFDSFILKRAWNYLLEADNRLCLPTITSIQVLTSSKDVLHSWAIPRLALKVDARPNRLNRCNFLTIRRGLIYGQCSEICGANHRFIPIVLELIPLEAFKRWLEA